MAVPAGFSKTPGGIPLSIQIIGKPFDEETQRIVGVVRQKRLPDLRGLGRLPRSEGKKPQLEARDREIGRNLDRPRDRRFRLPILPLAGEQRAVQKVEPCIVRIVREQTVHDFFKRLR